MAAAPFRPPWFGHIGVQVLGVFALLYNLVQLATRVIDGLWGEAFLSFAWCVLFGYIALESWRFRKEQQAEADDGPPAD